MGAIILIGRLAARDLRRGPGPALLLLLVITAATATLTLGLTLHNVTSKPYQQTRQATAGPDVVASSVGYDGPDGLSAAARSRFDALATAPGVDAHSGPFPVAWPVLRACGQPSDVMAEGRTAGVAAVDQPKVIQGSWVRPDGIVLERGFAAALGVHVGARVTLAGTPFRVAGIAVTAAVPVYSQVCFYGGCIAPGRRAPSFDTGLAWVTEADARRLAATAGTPLTYYLNLRLSDPAAAPAFVRQHQPPENSGPPALTSWQSLQSAAATLVTQEQQVLVPASWLLTLLAAASVAVLAGSRMAEQERRVGLLKAAGGTPPAIAGILLAEHIVVALAGALAGLAAGWLCAPLLTSPGASLAGSPASVPLGWTTAALVTAIALAVAAGATAGPAIRAARSSTVAALAQRARAPKRRGWFVAVSARCPVSLLLAVRLVARRPRRALLSAAGFTVSAATLVAVLTFHATLGLDARRGGPFAGPANPGDARVSQVLLVVTVVMGLLASINTLVTTWGTVLDSRRFTAIVRSLGASPLQTAAGLSVAQLLPALAGALLGIPCGVALYATVQGGGAYRDPAVLWLAAMVIAVLIAVVALTAFPVRFAVRRPVTEILQAELS